MKNEILKVFVLIFIATIPLISSAQDRVYRKYASMDYLKTLYHSQENLSRDRYEIENNIRSQNSLLDQSFNGNMIPVVFNVLQSSKTISETQIYSQIDALNRDFGNTEAQYEHAALDKENFRNLSAKFRLEFCIPSSINSIPIEGIKYINSNKSTWPINNDIKSESLGGIDAQHPDKVINVWIADLEDNIAGFAQMPGGETRFDGIVIDVDFFGIGGTSVSPYDEGKTLTHLMGNFFNLFPLWGPEECADDQIIDTPIHNGPNYGCPEYRHISTCTSSNLVEMTMNFMDNTDDTCTTMFTKGQKQRMYASLISGGSRYYLMHQSIECRQIN